MVLSMTLFGIITVISMTLFSIVMVLSMTGSFQDRFFPWPGNNLLGNLRPLGDLVAYFSNIAQ